MTEQQAPVVFEERDAGNGFRLGIARLNRPRQLNALDLEMCELMLAQFRRWASDQSIACVLLEGEGDKGLCAGGDVATVVRQVRAGGSDRFVYGDSFFEVEYQLDLMIHTYPKPFVCWGHGVVMGGGVGLMVGASHRIVSEKGRLAMPEIHIGLFPDVGGGWFLNRLPGGAGLLMALTGVIVNEADALFAGLADYFVPRDQHAAVHAALLALDWTGRPAEDRARLSRLLAGIDQTHRERLPASGLRERFDTIRGLALAPTVTEYRDALLEAARADSWLEGPAENLAKGSPTTAHVAWEYLRRCRQRSIAQTLELDLVLARQFQRHRDFCEGVRALLIDKDRTPAWSPARFEEVGPELVAAHFMPLAG